MNLAPKQRDIMEFGKIERECRDRQAQCKPGTLWWKFWRWSANLASDWAQERALMED